MRHRPLATTRRKLDTPHRITETARVPFRAEAFNATNTYFRGRNNFINDPNNSNFGAFFRRDATSRNRCPRQIQLAVKFMWQPEHRPDGKAERLPALRFFYGRRSSAPVPE